MIKAEDLRIGDLVRIIRDCKYSKRTLCAVTGIPAMKGPDKIKVVSLSAINDNDDSPWGTWCCNVEGIPLTPEILEKNGWKKRTEGWYFMMISKYMYLSVEFGYENGIRVFLKRTTDGLYVKLNVANNVHELQHILWALGLDAEIKL